MPAKLEPGKKIKRLIKVYGIENWVEVTISHEGLSIRVPKTRKSLVADWPAVVEHACSTPDDCPSFLAGEPTKFLIHETGKVNKKKLEEKA